MGQLEKIYMLLTVIANHLNIDIPTVLSADANVNTAPTANGVIAPAGDKSAAIAAATPAPASVAPAPASVATLTVVDALAQGLKLTGNELDANGVPHLPAVNSQNPAVTTKNIWKKGKGISADVYAAAIAAKQTELKNAVAIAAGIAPAPAPAGTAPMPNGGAAPMPSPAGAAPMPNGGAAPAPMPSQHVDIHQPKRTAILDEINKLTKELEIDFDSVVEVLTEFGSTDASFTTVPVENYDGLLKSLVGWSECLLLVARVTADVLALNGNDQAVIIEHIYNGGQFGCTDPVLVHKSDIWRLYELLAGYRSQLEAHFQKPVTEMVANPFL
ncbi:hypothetical protein NVP1083O_44 [Vibrio phage 1.083.O._10N.286.52.B9]|nr:hypothetical protein NVP1083O_44 [Vibrio phage 1.083.O._10N.286.52.B9]